MNKSTSKASRGAILATTVRALRHRNFRLFFVGQSISLIGTWMQRLAVGWLVYRLTHSAFLLGLVGFVGQVPTLLLAPIAGVLADRWNRHRLLIFTQTLAMVQAFVLSWLVLGHLIEVWQIIVLSIVLGIVNAFDMPIRQSFMVEMIDERRDLSNAIALNSSMVNGGRLLGPSIAGVLIAAVGEGVCFLINALSYLAVIISLFLMKIGARELGARRPRVWHDIAAGFDYAIRFEPIRAILLLLALIGFMGMPYTVLMPVFAKDILHGGADALGFLMGCAGIGALVGALFLASRKSVLGLGRMIPLAAAVFGLGLVWFSLSRALWISLPLMLLVGFGQMVQLAASNTLLQTIVSDDKRGRIMSLYTMAFLGMTPLGSLAVGLVASSLGAPWTVGIGGVACLAGAILFARRLPFLREKIRPIYVSLGVLPAHAAGHQAALDSSESGASSGQ